jgi:ribonuclease P protein subunit RPR2
MIRVASERVNDLFALAAAEAPRGATGYADRYVRLARKVGMRYNVRLLPEYRELYCRGCSTFWVEGRTVRTRLRSGRRVRTCLVCGRSRRVPLRPSATRPGPDLGSPGTNLRDEFALAEAPTGIDENDEESVGDDES